MIEGNRLTQQQVAQVIADGQHFPGRERDQGGGPGLLRGPERGTTATLAGRRADPECNAGPAASRSGTVDLRDLWLELREMFGPPTTER